jgi:hypothetical protein
MRRHLAGLLPLVLAACTSTPTSLYGVDATGAEITSVMFPSTLVGAMNRVTIRLQNPATTATGPIVLALQGVYVADFKLTDASCGGTMIAAQSSCPVTIEFAPTGTGTRDVALDVHGNAGEAVRLDLSGVGTSMGIELSPTSLAFNATKVGMTATSVIHIKNTGTGPAGVDSALVIGEGFSTPATTCNAPLAPNASCDVMIEFAPTALMSYVGTLQITSSSSAFQAALSGTGI